MPGIILEQAASECKHNLTRNRKVMAPLDDALAVDIDADDEGDENSSLLQWAETCRDRQVLTRHWSLVVPFKIAFHGYSFSPVRP